MGAGHDGDVECVVVLVEDAGLGGVVEFWLERPRVDEGLVCLEAGGGVDCGGHGFLSMRMRACMSPSPVFEIVPRRFSQ